MPLTADNPASIPELSASFYGPKLLRHRARKQGRREFSAV